VHKNMKYEKKKNIYIYGYIIFYIKREGERDKRER